MNDAAPRKVHPLVELDYRVRLGAYLIVAVALAASFYETGASPVAWVAMLVQCLAWPHVARAVARASRDSKRTELANLLVDAAIIGAWIAVISFDPWLTTTYVISLTVAFLSVGGIRFSLQAMAVLCVSSALTVWIGGLRPTAASSPLTMGIGIAALLVYMSLFGLATNRQARHIVQNTRTIARQKEEMEAFAEVTAAISASLELTQVLDTIVRRAVTLSRADAGAIFEFDPTTGAFVAVASHNLTPAFLDRIRATPVDPTTGVIRRANESGQPFQIPDIAAATEYIFRDVTLREGFAAMLVAPIPGRNITRGIALFSRAKGRYPDRTVEMLVSLATHSRVALSNARLFQEVERQRRELEIASRHKSQFLANMSHELRTPLNAILGYTELIEDGIYGEVPPRIAEVLSRVQVSGRHLLGLINDVLDLSKIEAGQLVLSVGEYAIDEIVSAVRSATESLAAEKGLAFDVELPPAPPRAVGDARRITQVLLNLVGNALKFTDAGGVRLRVDVVDAAFLVSVTDTGPGIPEPEHERIFEEFHQADGTTTRKKGGTGLGLAIARRIVQMHGGRIWVESKPDAGSTFRFTLPLRPPSPETRGEPTAVEERL